MHDISSNSTKRLEVQLRTLENDRPPTNSVPTVQASAQDGDVDQMEVDSSPSQNALGKRPERHETDSRARLEVESNLSSNDLS